MKYTTWIIILIFFLITITGTCQAFTDKEIQSIISRASASDALPDAVAVILARESSVTIGDLLNRTTQEEVLLKILKGNAKNDYGDLKVLFDERYDTVTIPVARTFCTDGSVVPIMDGADNIIIPPSLIDAAVYLSIKQRVISFSGVEPGAVLHWKVKVATAYPENDRFLWGQRSFMEDIPILKETFMVYSRNDVPIRIDILNGLEDPVPRNEKQFKVFTWKRENVPALKPEWDMTSRFNVEPRLVYTTVPDWESIARWFQEKFFLSARVSNRVKKEVRLLVGEHTGDWVALDAIYRQVAGEIRDIDLPLGMRGYLPNSPDTVLESRYGDNLDKAALLWSMVTAAGFHAAPVMFPSVSMKISDDFPSISLFDAIGIVVEDPSGGDRIWLDVSGEDLKTGTFIRGQDNQAIIISETGYTLNSIPAMVPEQSRTWQTLEFDVHPDGSAQGVLRWEGTGYFDTNARKRFREKTDRDRKLYIEQLFGNDDFSPVITSVTMTDWSDFNKTAFLEMSFTVPRLAVPESNLMVLALPQFPFGFAQIHLPEGKIHRQHPVEIATRCVEHLKITVELPSRYSIISRPGSGNKSCPALDVTQRFSEEGKTVTLERTLTWRDKIIPPEMFTDVKEITDHFLNLEQNLILLEKTGGIWSRLTDSQGP